MAYCIREVRPDDLSVCTLIETLGFPPAEGASRESIAARIEAYPSHFLVAEDALRRAGRVYHGRGDGFRDDHGRHV